VPVPENNYNLYAACNGKPLTDIYKNLLESHRENRIKGNEMLLMAFSNYIHFFETRTFQKEPLNKVETDLNFRMLVYASKKYLGCTSADAGNVKIILVVHNARFNKRMVYFN
jgi:hypothetical protein